MDNMDPLEKAVADLGEHFESVLVIVTTHEGSEGSGMQSMGAGNVYARIGSAREWLMRMDESIRAAPKAE